MSLKIGRNDPCPCGSGKKYKKCCGQLAESTISVLDPFEKYNQVLTAVKMKLDQHYATSIRRLRKEGLQTFLFHTVKRVLPTEHETIFSDWLWFDRVDPEEPSLAEQYLTDHGVFMEKPLQDCMRALSDSVLSVYRVTGAQDNWLKVTDIFSNKEVEVLLKEPWAGEQDRSVLIMGRIAATPEGRLFSGMVLIIENETGQEQFLTDHYQYLRQLNIYPHFIPSEVVYGLFDHAHKKVFFNLRDIRMLRFEPERRQVILDAMGQYPRFDLLHHTDDVYWFAPCKEHYDYVRLAVGPDYLVAVSDVLADIQDLLDQVSALTGTAELDLVSSTFLRRPPAAEYIDIWFTIMKDQQTESWLNTPHKELDDQTPRQILEQPEGKQRVTNMLDEFAAGTDSEDQQELLTYMRMRLQAF